MSYPLCYTVCMIIKIEAIKPLATQRTKNRIREHGANGFMVERRNDNAFPPMWLLRGNDWLGWLPISEFRVIETKESAWHLLK